MKKLHLVIGSLVFGSLVFGSLVFGSLVILSSTAFGQDPLKVAPEAYKLEFENEWVKVTRVHYAAKVKLPAHDHTETGAAYVYLNDSGPVIFRHIGLNYGAITRPATKAASFRLYKAVKEVHEVENPNDAPSDFLRVEFKTASDTAKPLRGKYFREEAASAGNSEKVQFENDQIRVTRVVCAASCEVRAEAAAPALLVSLTKIDGAEAGKTRWIEAGKKQTIGAGGAEFLRFDFKSRPAAEKPAAHPHE